jgi:hypothetical protein
MPSQSIQPFTEKPLLSFHGFRIVSESHAILFVFLRTSRLVDHPVQLDRQLHRPVEAGDDADPPLDDDLGLRRRQGVIRRLQRLDAAQLPFQERLGHRRPSGICC